MKLISTLLVALSFIFIVATLIPIITLEEWFVRIFDFPRLQLFFLSLVVLVGLIFLKKNSTAKVITIILLAIAIMFQGYKMLPYTVLAKKTVPNASNKEPTVTISLLVVNVYMHNDQFGRLLEQVDEYAPDLVLTLETDTAWENALKMLENSYAYTIKVPKDNTYGMHLYSKLPLLQTEVKYWLDKDIPSIRTQVKLTDGSHLILYGVHPRPPVPTEDGNSRKRDAEIIIVANRVSKLEEPVLVAGDFNDVAWSSTTELFKNVSGLLDPRIGRGFFNTFNAKIPLFRWPLDHVFHSSHFQVISIERLPSIGSDHFPIYINLKYQPESKKTKPEASKETKELETQTINEGIEEAERNE